MTIDLNPQQEEAIRAAIRNGHVSSVEEFIDRAVAELAASGDSEAGFSRGGQSVFEQGLGLFGSPEDSALLDEIVSIAYQERRRPTRREPGL